MTKTMTVKPGIFTRRPGIEEIQQQLRQQHPHKSGQEIATLAKQEWHRQQLQTK